MGVSLGGGDNWFCLLSYLWPNVYQNPFFFNCRTEQIRLTVEMSTVKCELSFLFDGALFI